jgi:hypothetical protein
MKLIAIHEIEYCLNRKRHAARPGHLFEVDDETGARLKKMGAARDPDDAELALEALRAGKIQISKDTKVEKEGEEQPKRRGRRRAEEGDDSNKDDDVV